MNTDMNSTSGNKYNLTFGKSDYVSDSVTRYEIFFLPRLDWYENLINIPVLFLDGNKKQFFTNKKGQTLPTSTQFKKLYEIEKQNYENEQALIRARQLQQQEEIRRLEQERLNKEAQIRLIEEENERQLLLKRQQDEQSMRLSHQKVKETEIRNTNKKQKTLPKNTKCTCCGKVFETKYGWFCSDGKAVQYSMWKSEMESSFLYQALSSSGLEDGVDPKYHDKKCAQNCGECY